MTPAQIREVRQAAVRLGARPVWADRQGRPVKPSDALFARLVFGVLPVRRVGDVLRRWRVGVPRERDQGEFHVDCFVPREVSNGR